jgi:LigXa C-terminal domain like
MQALEGDIDTGHLSFLHAGHAKPDGVEPGSFDYYALKDRAPRYVVTDTEFGTTYGAYRPAESDTTYWRIAHFLFPSYSMIPVGILGANVLGRIWVPMDDENSMLWMMRVIEKPDETADAPTQPGTGIFVPPEERFKPNGTGWYDRFVTEQGRGNDYLIDRDAQRRLVSYTGILAGPQAEDQAVTESMGHVYQRSQEHLGTTDAMVIRTRRRLLAAARSLAEHGVVPPGVDDPGVYRTRAGGVILPNSDDWLESTKDLRRAFVKHENLSEAPLTAP